MKLVIQIPCLNERDHLPATFADLPRSVPGFDEIEVLIVDDGSRDGTSEVAAALGAHHIFRFPRNRGLAAAHMAGLDAAYRLGADVVVNTDADNQYRGADIAALVAPVVEGRADIVVGDRQTDKIPHFSARKKRLQRWGSATVRRVSGTDVRDSTSGFRAMNRRALERLFVHNRFTYTIETIVQAGNLGLVVENVDITTNEKTRESRLFSSIGEYVRRNGAVILRAYAMYWPVRSFGIIAAALFLGGLALGLRFAWAYLEDPTVSRHVQSLQIGVGAIIMSFVVALMAMLSDLLATNRRLSEELVARVRRLDAAIERLEGHMTGDRSVEGVKSTGASPWRAQPSAESVASVPPGAAVASAAPSNELLQALAPASASVSGAALTTEGVTTP